MPTLTSDVAKNAVVDDPMATLRNAFATGTDPEAAIYEGTSTANSADVSKDGDEDAPKFFDIRAEQEAGEKTEETQEAASETQPAETPEAPQTTDVEVVWVKGPNGQKQKLEIKYSDKQAIKDAYLKAAGMRKFAAERDQIKKTAAELEQKYATLSTDMGKLEDIFKTKGAKGIFEQLGGQGAWDKAVAEELAQRERLAAMSPEERFQMAQQEKEQTFSREKQELEKKYNDMLSKIEAEKTQAATKALESKLSPAFEKYRFKDKLGDDVAEHQIDKAVWTETMNRLSEYPETVELTQALIDKEFRSVAAIYKKVLDTQTNAKLKSAVTKQKDSATERAQVSVKKQMAGSAIESKVQEDIKNSNWSSVFQRLAGIK